MNTHVSSHSSPASVALAIRNLALKSIEPSATAVQERRRTHYDAGGAQGFGGEHQSGARHRADHRAAEARW